MAIRVLVVDDQSMVRAGLRMLLAIEPDIDVVAEAGNGREAIAQAARYRPDIVLMDIRMPELDGLEATRRILAADDTVRVMILTTFNLDDYVYEALRAGASGFVLKDDPPEQLISAVRTVAAGDALLSPRSPAASSRTSPVGADTRHRRAVRTLTVREMDVFRLIALGFSNAEIGRKLFISDTTVKTHVTRCCRNSTFATGHKRSSWPTRAASSTPTTRPNHPSHSAAAIDATRLCSCLSGDRHLGPVVRPWPARAF